MSTALEPDLGMMPKLDDDLPVHITCCEDEHLAYCGKRIVGDNFEPQDTPVTCAACIVSDEMDFCPKLGKCPY